eukprot:89414-Ditylum_brightwellii.AAC.1
MAEGEPLQMSDNKKLKTLSKIDIENDEECQSVPILVTTNRERVDWTAQNASMFAELKNQHVIRWPLEKKNGPTSQTLTCFL